MKYEISINSQKKLLLSPFEPNDISNKSYKDWFNDPEVIKNNSHGVFPYTSKQQRDFINNIENNKIIVWKILTKENGISFWIGNVSLQKFNWIDRSAELAIIIGNIAEHKQGVGTKACLLVIRHGFDKLNLHRIWTGTAKTNIGMNRVCEKLDMQHEGILKDGIFLNGQYEDINLYGILNNEEVNDTI